MDRILADEGIAKEEMVRMLKEELTDTEINTAFDTCNAFKVISPEVQRVVTAIDDLCGMMVPVADAKSMEAGYKRQCREIKEQKLLIRKCIQQIETKTQETQCDFEPEVFTEETFKEVEKVIKVPVEVIKTNVTDVSVDVQSEVLEIVENKTTKTVEREVIKVVD
jgi:hypothetical protein